MARLPLKIVTRIVTRIVTKPVIVTVPVTKITSSWVRYIATKYVTLPVTPRPDQPSSTIIEVV